MNTWNTAKEKVINGEGNILDKFIYEYEPLDQLDAEIFRRDLGELIKSLTTGVHASEVKRQCVCAEKGAEQLEIKFTD